jgi:hypothetical protein
MNPLGDRLRLIADSIDVQPASADRLERAARRRRSRHRATSAFLGVLAVAAVALPLRSLSGLGGAAVAPHDDPWTETYVLSHFEVQYPMIVPDVAPNEPVEDNTPTKLDPTMALVTFRGTWSGDVYPGEAQCEIRLFDADGDTVGQESFGFGSFEPPPKNPTSMEVAVDHGTPVSADGTCGPGDRPGPGTYLVSNLHVVAGDNGDHLMADVAWSTKTPPLLQYCVASFDMPDGSRRDKPFEMSVPPEKDTTILLLPHGFVAATPLGVRCEPYTGHNGDDGTDRSPSSIAVGDEFGGFQGLVLSERTLGTEDIARDDFEGEVEIKFFWASWSAGTGEYLGSLEGMDQRYGTDLAVLGIDVRDDEAAALELLETAGVSFVNLADPSGEIAERFGVKGIPIAFVVDGGSNEVLAIFPGSDPGPLESYVAARLGSFAEPTYYVDGGRPTEGPNAHVRCVPWSVEAPYLLVCQDDLPGGFIPGGPPGGIGEYPDVCALALQQWDFDPKGGLPIPADLEDVGPADGDVVDTNSSASMTPSMGCIFPGPSTGRRPL